MRMDPVLFTALKAGQKIVHLVTVYLAGHTIRWTDGGYVRWSGDDYTAKDATYGVLSSIGDIADGVDDDASPVELEIIPPNLTSIADLTAIDAQGGLVTIHLGAIDRSTGVLLGDPYELHRGYLDRPLYSPRNRRVSYDILTSEALGLEPNEDQRQTDAFHQSVWPGELGYEYQTDGSKKVFWRDDDPNNAIGFISPRPKKGGDPLLFTYETDAGWPFPFGRCAVPGLLNYRVGYGPTNRYQSIFATLAASGPIKAIVSTIVDEETVTFDATYGKAQNGDHSGAMWMQFKLGTQPQTALTSPTGPGAGTPALGWGTNHKQSGKAVYCWTGFENSKKSEFGSGIPSIVNVLDGLYQYDPRDPDCLLTDPETWVYSENPIIAALNWALGRWEGDSGGGKYGVPHACSLVGGIGSLPEGVDIDQHIYAADVADTNGWTVTAAPTSADDKHEVRKKLLQAGGATPSRSSGKIGCISHGAVQDSEMDVTNADTAGDVEVQIWASRLDRKNTAIPSHMSQEHRWEITALAPVTNAAWRTEDGGKQSTGFEYPYVPAADQAAQLCYYDLANGRELSGEAPFKPHMLALEPGAMFTWQEPEFLLVDAKAQVRKRVYSPSKTVVKIAFRGETDAKHVDAFEQTGTAPPPYVPVTPPVRPGVTAETPITRDDDGGAITGTVNEIVVAAFNVIVNEGEVAIPAQVVGGLDSLKTYGTFYREDLGIVVEEAPAFDRMSGAVDGGGFIFLGWQGTSDGTNYPTPPPRPPGSGGTGDVPAYIDP